MKKKPVHFLIFKILGFLGICMAIAGFFLTIVGFDDFESNNFMLGGFMTTFGLFLGVSLLIAGFSPDIAKIGTRTMKYIQSQNKEDLTEIASTSAEIAKDAVTTLSSAVKDGFSEKTIFCKHCGKSIDADSRFCSHCGKEQ